MADDTQTGAVSPGIPPAPATAMLTDALPPADSGKKHAPLNANRNIIADELPPAKTAAPREKVQTADTAPNWLRKWWPLLILLLLLAALYWYTERDKRGHRK